MKQYKLMYFNWWLNRAANFLHNLFPKCQVTRINIDFVWNSTGKVRIKSVKTLFPAPCDIFLFQKMKIQLKE